MKKIFSATLFILLILNPDIYSEPKNPVLEYCTGTWCPTCPCAHRVIRDSVLVQHPNTIVVSYHGQPTSTDPFRNFNGNQILSMMGFVSYASGIVNRTSSPKPRTFWVQEVNTASTDTASVNITVVKNFNITTRELTAVINLRALGNLTGAYYVNYILTEDSLLTTQNGNATCIGGTNYRLDHVVRDMINSPAGELITDVPWNAQQVIVKNLNYTVSNTYNPYNTFLIVMVYKNTGGAFNLNTVQQAYKTRISDVPLSIVSTGIIAESYSLQQNYPNPFNPTTDLEFGIANLGFVSLRIYDALGKEVATLVNNTLPSGSYRVRFDASKLPSGVYFYELLVISLAQTGDFVDRKKMILIR